MNDNEMKNKEQQEQQKKIASNARKVLDIINRNKEKKAKEKDDGDER